MARCNERAATCWMHLAAWLGQLSSDSRPLPGLPQAPHSGHSSRPSSRRTGDCCSAVAVLCRLIHQLPRAPTAPRSVHLHHRRMGWAIGVKPCRSPFNAAKVRQACNCLKLPPTLGIFRKGCILPTTMRDRAPGRMPRRSCMRFYQQPQGFYSGIAFYGDFAITAPIAPPLRPPARLALAVTASVFSRPGAPVRAISRSSPCPRSRSGAASAVASPCRAACSKGLPARV